MPLLERMCLREKGLKKGDFTGKCSLWGRKSCAREARFCVWLRILLIRGARNVGVWPLRLGLPIQKFVVRARDRSPRFSHQFAGKIIHSWQYRDWKLSSYSQRLSLSLTSLAAK
jgi:hypothetical protein